MRDWRILVRIVGCLWGRESLRGILLFKDVFQAPGTHIQMQGEREMANTKATKGTGIA